MPPAVHGGRWWRWRCHCCFMPGGTVAVVHRFDTPGGGNRPHRDRPGEIATDGGVVRLIRLFFFSAGFQRSSPMRIGLSVTFPVDAVRPVIGRATWSWQFTFRGYHADRGADDPAPFEHAQTFSARRPSAASFITLSRLIANRGCPLTRRPDRDAGAWQPAPAPRLCRGRKMLRVSGFLKYVAAGSPWAKDRAGRCAVRDGRRRCRDAARTRCDSVVAAPRHESLHRARWPQARYRAIADTGRPSY